MTAFDPQASRPGLLISVGGTAAPIAYSLNHHRPERVIFLASTVSRPQIETEVRPLVQWPWADREVITVADPQDLHQCMEALSVELPGALAALGLSPEELIVDYTGGTKTMSAALVLATVHMPVRYSYVGGTVRTKEGAGVVVDGSEEVLRSPNPWDVLALQSRRDLAAAFNGGRFEEATRIASHTAARVSEGRRGLYAGLKQLCEGYARWETFDYGPGVKLVRGGVGRLAQYARAAREQPLIDFVARVEQDVRRMDDVATAAQALRGGKPADRAGREAILVDLVANALRATRLAGRPEDGVARLYGALEKLAKAALLDHGIDNSGARPEQIPEDLREEYTTRYMGPEGEALQIPLHASYGLLEALDDPLGRRYRAREADLRKVLDVRNASLMTHGWAPVSEGVFSQMLAIALDFMQLDEQQLPRPPELPEA